MKKLILLFALALSFSVSTKLSAQVVVDGVNINNLDQISMIRMIAIERFLSNKVSVFIDYGQSINGGARSRMEVVDPRTDKRIQFNSIMHAVNYMIDNGWTYLESMVLPNENGSATTTGSVQYLFIRQ